MREIRITLENGEFDKLEAKKGKFSWHDFILKCAGIESK
jgi:hypothetical protein